MPEDAVAEWIGESEPAQDKLDLAQIRAVLPEQAADLQAMLADARVTTLDARRRRASREASLAQQSFRRLGWVVVAGSAVAALASGLVLYGAGTGESPAPDARSGLAAWAHAYQRMIIAIQVLALFSATVAGAVLAARDYGRLWTEARRRAEADRIALIEAVIALGAQSTAAASPTRLRQALEFFRRYQLDLQIGYYTARASRHVASDTKGVWAAAALSGLAAVMGLLAALGPSFAAAAAFLGIAVPIVLAAIRSWRVGMRDAEKAGSYVAARDALEEIRQDLDGARAAADRGDAAAVAQFAIRVHGIMRTENGAWAGAGEIPEVAVAAQDRVVPPGAATPSGSPSGS